jgi:hypothetical protein
VGGAPLAEASPATRPFLEGVKLLTKVPN